MTDIKDSSSYLEKSDTKETLIKLIKESIKVFEGLGLPHYIERLEKLYEKLENKTSKILILSSFAGGKSTFINALLGEYILPPQFYMIGDLIPIVRDGEKKKALLHFKNPLPDNILSDIPSPTLNHMKTYGMKDVPPLEVEFDKFRDYVGEYRNIDPWEISQRNPFHSIEFYYPLPFLKDIEIIEGPAIDSCDEDVALTLGYLDKADHIIFLLNALHACSLIELDFIEEVLIPKGFKDIVFVVNRTDGVSKNDIEVIKDFIKNKVSKYTSHDIFYISALRALEGKTENDPDKLSSSGILEFEKMMKSFGTNKKGNLELDEVASKLKFILNQIVLLTAVPLQKSQWLNERTMSGEKYENIKYEIYQYLLQTNVLRGKIENKVYDNKMEIYKQVFNLFCKIDNQIEKWVTEFKPKTESVIFVRKPTLEETGNEIVEYVSSKIREVFSEWEHGVLYPLIEKQSQEIFNSLNTNLDSILTGLDALLLEISNKPVSKELASSHPKEPTWEKIWDIPVYDNKIPTKKTIQTDPKDRKCSIDSLNKGWGNGVNSLEIGMVQPNSIIEKVVEQIMNNRSIFGINSNVKLKQLLIREMRDILRRESDKKSAEIADRIGQEFLNSIKGVTEIVEVKIKDLNVLLENVLVVSEQEENTRRQRTLLIQESEEKLKNICGELNNFIERLEKERL